MFTQKIRIITIATTFGRVNTFVRKLGFVRHSYSVTNNLPPEDKPVRVFQSLQCYFCIIFTLLVAVTCSYCNALSLNNVIQTFFCDSQVTKLIHFPLSRSPSDHGKQKSQNSSTNFAPKPQRNQFLTNSQAALTSHRVEPIKNYIDGHTFGRLTTLTPWICHGIFSPAINNDILPSIFRLLIFLDEKLAAIELSISFRRSIGVVLGDDL